LLKIIPLCEEHLEDAAALVSHRYENLRQGEPLLPGRYGEVSTWLPLLHNIMGAGGPGVGAIRDGRLVGFLVGWLMPNFRGVSSVYSPEWGNAADLKDSRYIYEEMYTHLAADWVADKYLAHYISIFANDVDAINAWHWLGFGMNGIDAIRGMGPINGVYPQIEIRHANSQNLEQVIELNDGLRGYMKGSPVFFIAEKFSQEYFMEWLEDPDKVIWLAYVNEKPVAFMQMGPANDDVCTIIYNEKTTSIYAAFTVEKMRGAGIATALLDHAIASAKDAGYERCAVDFETMNLLGTRFWLRHFKPVCYSLLRNVDERVSDQS
jgi:GNAT superfamily N-acetyltransferase